MANKVVDDWYRARPVEKNPTMDRLCRLCGRRYGEHYGRAPYCSREDAKVGNPHGQVFADSGGLMNAKGYLYDRPKVQILNLGKPNTAVKFNPNIAFKFRKNK